MEKYTILGCNKDNFTVEIKSKIFGKDQTVVGKFPNNLFQCFMFEYANLIDFSNSRFDNVME